MEIQIEFLSTFREYIVLNFIAILILWFTTKSKMRHLLWIEIHIEKMAVSLEFRIIDFRQCWSVLEISIELKTWNYFRNDKKWPGKKSIYQLQHCWSGGGGGFAFDFYSSLK